MSKLASALVSKKNNDTLKAYILLQHLGGLASTTEIKEAGRQNGYRAVENLPVAAIFGRGGERVTKKGGKWWLLDEGKNYLARSGFPEGTFEETAIKQSHATANKNLKIFIGHGRAKIWVELSVFLSNNYDCEVREFNSQSVAGETTVDILKELLDFADVAFLLMSAEDEQNDGKIRARQNVIHEIGLFQGKLGFNKAIVVLEETCEEFSNIAGLGQIRFPKGNIASKYEEVRAYLKKHFGLVGK